MSDILSIATNVKTVVGLAAFAVGVVGWLLHQRVESQQRLIESAPEAERGKLIETLLTDYRITQDNLTADHKFALVKEQLAAREKRTNYVFRLATLVCVLLAALIAIELLRGDPISDGKDAGLGVEPQGAIANFSVHATSVEATVQNQGTVDFSVVGGKLYVACPDEEDVVVPLTLNPAAAAGANKSIKLNLEAKYQRFNITLPQTSQCNLTLELEAATGSKTIPLTAHRPGSGAVRGRDHVTLFDFSAPDSEAHRVSDEYAQAVKLATVEVSRSQEPNGSDIELLRINTEAPQVPSDIEQVQLLSRSLVVASGMVLKNGDASLVRANMFIAGIEPELREQLANIALPYGPAKSFEQARQLNEIAVYYSLAKTLARRNAPVPTVVAYLRLADNVARSLLKSPELPGELRSLIETWAAVLNTCLTTSINAATATREGSVKWCG